MALIRVNWDPSERDLRFFGWGLVLMAAGLGGALAWRARPMAGAAVGGVLGLAGFATLLRPRLAGRRIYRAWMSVAWIIGTVLSSGVLALIYFGILTPIGLVMRLAGRDALGLRRRGETYWVPLEFPEDPQAYERLF